MTGPVGLIGASGAVGQVVADRLVSHAVGPLRLGGRDTEVLHGIAAATDVSSTVRAVDVGDPDSLARFVDGCQVVVNCAGPSYLVLDRVATAAARAGAHYVDAAGDVLALRSLREHGGGDGPTVTVFSAGLMPGLTGLLPRLLPRALPAHVHLDRLDTFVGGAVRIGRLSAVDALLSRGDGFGEALACFRDGEVVRNALEPLPDVTLPGFSGAVHAWPFLTEEVCALARRLGIREARSHTVYVSHDIPEALAAAWADPEGDREQHVDAVVTAADRDVERQGSWYTLLIQLRSDGGGSARILLQTTDSYALSGVVAAHVTREIVAGRVPPGGHLMPDVIDAARTVQTLRDDPLVTRLDHPDPWKDPT